MDRYSQRAMNGAALAPLNNRQKARICILARIAFRASFSEVGRRPPAAPSSHSSDGSAIRPYLFKNWRHEQQRKAVGREHLTDCRNADYLALKAHFQNVAGDVKSAFRNHLRAAGDPRSWALAKLRKECAAAADVLPGAWNYAAGFLQNKRGLAIEDCPERDLWHAVFLVRRRAAQLRKKFRSQKSEVSKSDLQSNCLQPNSLLKT